MAAQPFEIEPCDDGAFYFSVSYEWHCHWNDVAFGNLACGETGAGRLLDPDLIVEEVLKYLTLQQDQLKVLVTSGGTSEPIDDVRVITNRSTGATAAALSDSLIAAGYDVTYLHSRNALVGKKPCRKIIFETFQELQIALTGELKKTKYHSCFNNCFFHKWMQQKRTSRNRQYK